MGGAGSVRNKSSTSISLGGPNKTHSLFIYAPGRTAGWWSPPHPTKLRPRLQHLGWASPPQQQVDATAGDSFDVSIIKLREGVGFEGGVPAAPSHGPGARSERVGPPEKIRARVTRAESSRSCGLPSRPGKFAHKLARRISRGKPARLIPIRLVQVCQLAPGRRTWTKPKTRVACVPPVPGWGPGHPNNS